MLIKSDLEELAIFGGSPIFKDKLHVGRPNIGNRYKFIEMIDDMLDRRWFTNDGPYLQELETRICEYLNVKNCVAMCNGTIALEIVIRALGLEGEVIIPSFTFIATAHALQWQKINPIFCDIDPDTHNLDPNLIEKLITPKTSGIVGVHLWGRPCDINTIAKIALKNNLKLIFDSAHAFGCSYDGEMMGGFGDAEVFSFHATKFFNTFEGGAVVTNDDELANKMRLMRNFGFSGQDSVIYIGTNGKMSEVAAAMGLSLFQEMNNLVETNRVNYEYYQQGLENIRGVKVIKYNENEQCNYQYIVLEIEGDATGVNRDQLHHILWAENVLARRYFFPGCHLMEPYRTQYPDAGLQLRETENITKKVLLLPTGTSVKTDDIHKICNTIKFVVKNGLEINSILKKSQGPINSNSLNIC